MNKKICKKLFANKKITIMGLGLLGRGLQVSQFLAEAGAKLTITDLKTKEELKTSLNKLKKHKIRYVLGKHDLKDFEHAGLVIKSAGVPLDSIYIEHARTNKVPVEMDASLFTKIVKRVFPSVKIIGITGTRGKSMTTAVTYHLLKENAKALDANVFLGGNMRNTATLPILNQIESRDIVVMELDSWQCQGFGDNKISPNISVFTNIMRDHMNYYKNDVDLYLSDKANIYKFQKKSDVLITNKRLLKVLKIKPKSKVIIPDKKIIQSLNKLDLSIFGKHNLNNISYAIEVAKQCGLNGPQITNALKTFRGLEGRLQIIQGLGDKIIVNDNNSTTPEATAVGIHAVHDKYQNKDIVLIAGGSDKMLDLKPLIKELKLVHKIILLPGTGTNKLIENLRQKCTLVKDLREAVSEAIQHGKNQVILFSPGFASFGLFKNEYDRNDQFLNLIKKL